MQKTSPGFAPTPEQQAIIDATRGSTTSLMVSAYAGCAKTTTLTMLAKEISGPALAVAFNVKIKKELESRFPSNFQVKTLNGLGHSAWGKAVGKRLVLDDRKLGRITGQVLKAMNLNGDKELWGPTRRLATWAQHLGIVPKSLPAGRGLLPDTPETWEELAEENLVPEEAIAPAREILRINCQEALQGTVSFDDQIYMSALFGGVFTQFPTVLVDEAQDLSPLNHIQLKRSAGGRLIVVGDPKQAIYGFRGADHSSMENLRRLRREWVDLPLATTFRCPHIIVSRQQDHAPGFTAHVAAPQGEVKTWSMEGGWSTELLKGLPDPAVLCRNNAPLLALAFKLLRNRLGAVFLGRDLGRNLIALSKKIIPLDDTPREMVLRLVNEWEESQVQLALVNDQEGKLEGLRDRAESLRAVLEGAEAANAGELRKALGELFAKESGPVTLATGHRSKGLEWASVVHLDPWRVPSKRARAEGGDALIQEMNLKYVIETRTKHTLVLANLEDFAE